MNVAPQRFGLRGMAGSFEAREIEPDSVGVRWDLVMRARERIVAGDYDVPEVFDHVADRLTQALLDDKAEATVKAGSDCGARQPI